MLALAQLEARAAAPAAARPAFVRDARRRARRDTWQVRNTRGRAHRVRWRPERMQHLAGPEADPAITEDLGWDDVVRLLGWQDGLALWLWAVEGWSLSEIGAWQAITKQQVWRRLHQALAALRARLAPPRAGCPPPPRPRGCRGAPLPGELGVSPRIPPLLPQDWEAGEALSPPRRSRPSPPTWRGQRCASSRRPTRW